MQSFKQEDAVEEPEDSKPSFVNDSGEPDLPIKHENSDFEDECTWKDFQIDSVEVEEEKPDVCTFHGETSSSWYPYVKIERDDNPEDQSDPSSQHTRPKRGRTAPSRYRDYLIDSEIEDGASSEKSWAKEESSSSDESEGEACGEPERGTDLDENVNMSKPRKFGTTRPRSRCPTCSFCGYKFINDEALITHSKVHTDTSAKKDAPQRSGNSFKAAIKPFGPKRSSRKSLEGKEKPDVGTFHGETSNSGYPCVKIERDDNPENQWDATSQHRYSKRSQRGRTVPSRYRDYFIDSEIEDGASSEKSWAKEESSRSDQSEDEACDEPKRGTNLDENMNMSKPRKSGTARARSRPTCSFCGYKFFDDEALIIHLKVHTDTSAKKDAPQCSDNSFTAAIQPFDPTTSSKKPLDGKEKLYQCPNCDRRYRRSCHMLRHYRDSHSVAARTRRPVACHVCNYKARDQTCMKRHLWTHDPSVRAKLNLRSHQCPYCEHSTSQKANLDRHIRIHKGEKPFSCTSCDYKTAQQYDLVKHQFTHAKVKPFKCGYCKLRSSQKQCVQIHCKRKHPGRKELVYNVWTSKPSK